MKKVLWIILAVLVLLFFAAFLEWASNQKSRES